MISSSRVEEMSSGIEELDAGGNAGGNAGFSLCMSKISQGLRKFRNHRENFAIPANFRYAHFFAMITKFCYHIENSLS